MRWVAVRGVVGSVLVLVASFCYGRLPRPTWVGHVDPIVDVRGSAHHLALGLTLAFAGLGLLTWSWWRLVRLVRGRPDGVRAVRRTTALWVAPLLLAPPVFSGDGWSYVATGYLTGHGRSPYVATPAILPLSLRSGVDPRWLHTPSPYGPLAVAWGGIASHLTANPWLLLAAYRVLALGGLALLAWAVPRLALGSGRDPAEASAFVLASPVFVAHGIGGLHNDLAMVGLVAAALAVTRPGRWWWGAVLAGCAASVKVPGALAVVGVVLLSVEPHARTIARLRRTGAVAAVAGGVLLLSGALDEVGTGWLNGLAVSAKVRPLDTPSVFVGRLLTRTLTAGRVGVHLVHAIPVVECLRVAGVLFLLGLVGWVLTLWRGPDRAAALRATAGVLVAATVLSPVLHYWYVLWCIPLLASARLRAWETAAATAAVVVLGLTAPADPSLHLAWLTDLGAASILLAPPAVAAATVLLARTRPERPARLR